MAMDRLAMLEQLVGKTGEKGGDAFPLYGLAMEYRRVSRDAEAHATFERLHAAHPGYVPAYLMHGNLLERMGQAGEAAATYERGIAVAGAAYDDHALSELQGALSELRAGERES